MAILHDEIMIQGGTMPSLGSLLGSRVSEEVFQNINGNGFASFFGSDFDTMSRDFFNRYVKPMDQVSFDIGRTVNALLNPDRIRILESVEDFRNIPLSMEMPILLFEPVRKLLSEGRIEGFNYDPESLPEDAYGRMIENFTCHDVEAASDEDGSYSVSAVMYSDDPDLTDDELYSIRKTREYILNKILSTTDRDPTNIDLSRG